MAKKDEADQVNEQQAQAIDQINRRLDMFDHRLDNIDSVVSAVAGRVAQSVRDVLSSPLGLFAVKREPEGGICRS